MSDRLIRATAADGGIRAVGVITTHLTERARQLHELSFVATSALGRAMAAGLLVVSNMKQAQSRVNIRFRGNGPLGGIFVDAGLDGTVRGYADNPQADVPLNMWGKLDVGAAIGREGYLRVVRDVGYGYPYSSTTKLVTGEVGDDIANYLVISEQTPSALLVGVYVEPDGVVAAGGLLLQILPKAAEEPQLVDILEARISKLSGFTPLLREGKSLPEIFQNLLGDIDLHIFPEVQPVRFDCKCNFKRMMGALKMLGVDELRDMIEKDNGAEATCHFCNSVYHASSDHLAHLIADLQAESTVQ
ncbi:MAG: Hsp33 family molecular chaperone HslO [Cyanobacteria bacterium J06641_5]